MENSYEVIVLGLGGMGSAACCHLARRGVRVLGVEQFTPAHARGSSHGHSRVIRQAYFEDPAYVPLLLRAYELWRELEAETSDSLLTITGGLMIGPPDSAVVSGSVRSAREHGLPHEMLTAGEVRARFPALTPTDDLVALYETQAGFVRPEAAIRAHLRQAEAHGADLHFEEAVVEWRATNDGVAVTTDKGAYHADRLIVAAGAWAPQVLTDLGLPLTVERQVLYWFAPQGGIAPFMPDRFPIYIWEMEPDLHFYGFPAQGDAEDGVKVAFYRMGKEGKQNRLCDPDTVDRTVGKAETERMRRALAPRIPAFADAPLLAATVCLYTNTPDGHFVLARHPEQERVIVASPCSGHGYKFCPVIGEILADLATTGTTLHPIALFGVERFAE